MKKLKELYGMDEGLYRFQAIERFEEFMRPEDMTVLDFINEWESYYDKVVQIGKIKLPEDYLAYKLFKAVRISDENKLLTRATITNFKISEAKEKMKAIFASTTEIFVVVMRNLFWLNCTVLESVIAVCG